jgi:hypothetical protein
MPGLSADTFFEASGYGPTRSVADRYCRGWFSPIPIATRLSGRRHLRRNRSPRRRIAAPAQASGRSPLRPSSPDHDRLHQLVSARPPAGAHQMTGPRRRRVHRSVDGGQRIVIGLKRRENQRIGGKGLPTWVTSMRSVLRFISILPCRRPRTEPAPAPVRQHRFRVSHLGTSPPTWDGRGRHGSRLERS